MRRAVHIGIASLALAGAAVADGGIEEKLKLGQPSVQRGAQTVPRARLRITLLAFVDPVRSRISRPPKGTRFVAFKLRIENLTRRRWQGTVASWATLVRRNGREFDVLSPGLAQAWTVKLPAWNEGTTIEGKQKRVGYLGWIVPKGVTLRAFRYQLELGPDVATWVLPRR